MATQEKDLHPIDQNLYRFNIMYQLRQVESNRALLYKENEKQVLKTLLKSCRDVDGNRLHPIMDNIFDRSLQPIPSKTTAMVNRVSNTKTTKKAITVTSKATTLTPEAPNTSITKDVAQDGDTNTNHIQNIDGKQSKAYANTIERQLYDPKMSKVSVKIKLRRGHKPKVASQHKVVPEKEQSSIEKSAHRKIQVKRGKANKRSYK